MICFVKTALRTKDGELIDTNMGVAAPIDLARSTREAMFERLDDGVSALVVVVRERHPNGELHSLRERKGNGTILLQHDWVGDVRIYEGEHPEGRIGPRFFAGVGDQLGPMSSQDYYTKEEADVAFRAEVNEYKRKAG